MKLAKKFTRNTRRNRLAWAFGALIVLLCIFAKVSGVLDNFGNQPMNTTGTLNPGNEQTSSCNGGMPTMSKAPTTSKELQISSELTEFADWLKVNNAQGFVGEVGWPAADTSSTDWNQVARMWYTLATQHSIPSTAWATGSWWGEYNLSIYKEVGNEKTGLNSLTKQAEILETYLAYCNVTHGINLAGMEFGTDLPNFSNSEPGVAGEEYFYEPSSSLDYLAERSIKVIRLPFRWERIQPSLYGELNPAEVSQIRRLLDAAAKNDQKIILDLHNYGRYYNNNQVLVFGDGKLTQEHLTDVWLKLSNDFKGHAGLMGYDIMNEPYNLNYANQVLAARGWESISQGVLSSLRSAGDNNLIFIPGYDWSSLARWSANHPVSWIEDPANNFRYEAHHYWDDNGEGKYDES